MEECMMKKMFVPGCLLVFIITDYANASTVSTALTTEMNFPATSEASSTTNVTITTTSIATTPESSTNNITSNVTENNTTGTHVTTNSSSTGTAKSTLTTLPPGNIGSSDTTSNTTKVIDGPTTQTTVITSGFLTDTILVYVLIGALSGFVIVVAVVGFVCFRIGRSRSTQSEEQNNKLSIGNQSYQVLDETAFNINQSDEDNKENITNHNSCEVDIDVNDDSLDKSEKQIINNDDQHYISHDGTTDHVYTNSIKKQSLMQKSKIVTITNSDNKEAGTLQDQCKQLHAEHMVNSEGAQTNLDQDDDVEYTDATSKQIPKSRVNELRSVVINGHVIGALPVDAANKGSSEKMNEFANVVTDDYYDTTEIIQTTDTSDTYDSTKDNNYDITHHVRGKSRFQIKSTDNDNYDHCTLPSTDENYDLVVLQEDETK